MSKSRLASYKAISFIFSRPSRPLISFFSQTRTLYTPPLPAYFTRKFHSIKSAPETPDKGSTVIATHDIQVFSKDPRELNFTLKEAVVTFMERLDPDERIYHKNLLKILQLNLENKENTEKQVVTKDQLNACKALGHVIYFIPDELLNKIIELPFEALSSKQSTHIRELACEALAYLGGTTSETIKFKCLNHLFNQLQDTSPQIRVASYQAIAKISATMTIQERQAFAKSRSNSNIKSESKDEPEKSSFKLK